MDKSKRPSSSSDEHSVGTKRPRQEEGVPSIEIPGVPPDVATALAEAIRSTKSFFCHESKPLVWTPSPREEALELSLNRRNEEGNVLDTVLDRVEAAAAAATTPKEDKQAKRKERMKLALETWMDELLRWKPSTAEQKRSGSSPPFLSSCQQEMHEPQKQQQQRKRSTVSVPIACFCFVWDFQQHPRVAVRRASLHLCGQLLYRIEECRTRWAENTTLLDWIRAVLGGEKGTVEHSEQTSLWQIEALRWVDLLSTSFQDAVQVHVALRMLKQQCPASVVQSAFFKDGVNDDGDVKTTTAATTTGRNMATWRKLRDTALAYGEKEQAIVQKLIKRAHNAMDVLVPRMGDEVAVTDLSEQTTTTKLNDDDDDGDDEEDIDDIDWEEGDEDDAADAHVDAVERTLTMMKSTGALQGGQINISMQREEDEERCGTKSADCTDETKAKARQRLEKVVSSLNKKHLPRLSAWVEALTNVDSLQQNGRSLVTISLESSRKQGRMLDRLLQLKSTVAKTIAAASKLKVSIEQGEGGERQNNSHRILGQSHKSRQNLERVRAVERRLQVKSRSSGRRSTSIQIKYRKN